MATVGVWRASMVGENQLRHSILLFHDGGQDVMRQIGVFGLKLYQLQMLPSLLRRVGLAAAVVGHLFRHQWTTVIIFLADYNLFILTLQHHLFSSLNQAKQQLIGWVRLMLFETPIANIYNSLGGMGNCEDNSNLQGVHVPTLGRLGPVLDLKMVNYVWQKDYQGLYDYDSREVTRQTYQIKSNSYILFDKDKKVVREVGATDFRQDSLKNAAFEVLRKSNYYKIMPIYVDNEQYTLQKLLWLVVKTVPNHRYPLKERDIIKFGKQKIKIREIVLPDSNPSVVQDPPFKTEKKVYEDLKMRPGQAGKEATKEGKDGKQEIGVAEVQSVVTENEQTCRICLQGGQAGNPLICPCKCTGSVRYIHLTCLRMWLGKRLNVVRSKFCISIKWTPLSCEMCKTHYRYRIYLDNRKFYTVEIPKPAKPYIVLEVMKRNAEFSKIFHFVSLAETSKVSIGRKKEIDVKISDDISVSRHHANIVYDFQNRRFLLEDNKSKFGTLVLIKKNLLINPIYRGMALQMGGQIFAFETQRGQGSIPDYYDEIDYLNVPERGDRQVAQQDSEEENNQEFQDQQEEEEQHQAHNIPTNVNLNNPNPPNNQSVNQNHSLVVPNTSILIPLNPISNSIPSPSPNLNPVVSSEVEVVEILDS